MYTYCSAHIDLLIYLNNVLDGTQNKKQINMRKSYLYYQAANGDQ